MLAFYLDSLIASDLKSRFCYTILSNIVNNKCTFTNFTHLEFRNCYKRRIGEANMSEIGPVVRPPGESTSGVIFREKENGIGSLPV